MANKDQKDDRSKPDKTDVYEPEDPDSEMIVKPFCDCPSCHHWTTSVDWCPPPSVDFKNHSNKKGTHPERNVQPLLRSEMYPGRTPKISPFNPCNPKKLQQERVFKVLVHGEIIPQPVNCLSDTYFYEDIQMSLKNLFYKYSMPIQAFVWPALFRQLDVFMISHSQSGKTMAYLPAICTFCSNIEEKYQELSKYKGPLVVIVCSNSKQCEEIFDLIKKIYAIITLKPKVSIATYPIGNINTTDILIALPESLVYCLKSRILNLKRLCHLVLEDASVLLQRDHENIYKILNVSNEMVERRTSNIKLQLIVASERWSDDLKKLLQLMYIPPLVCMGNHLEAALYGNIQFECKHLESTDKKRFLIDLLKDKYYLHKTVLFCIDSKELSDVNKWLIQNDIETIVLDTTSAEEVEQCKIIWDVMRGGNYKVLICTDFDESLVINDAVWLLNYSFPTTWTTFLKRFSTLSFHYGSPLMPQKEKVQCKSFLMIDETCNEQMPRILNLLRRLGKDLPSSVKQYAEVCKINTENEKIHNKIDICQKLKLFGKCSDPLCEMRHLIRDDIDVSDDLPKNGKIVFKILHMKDVSQYVVQLIKHIELDGVVHVINNDDLSKPLTYTRKVKAKNIKIGQFYVHCDFMSDGEIFMLCRVLNIPNATFVEVKLATGVTLQTLQTKLYEIPQNLKIVDVYLCNLIPPSKDRYFSGRSFHTTRTSLECLEHKEIVFTADVFLQLDNTLWINNVVQVIRSNNVDVIKFNLTKHLINLKVAELSNAQISLLRKLCRKCDVSLPCYVKPETKKIVKEKEVEAQRSFLDENVNEVIFSSAVTPEEFYVRLYKYQRLLEDLEKDIRVAVDNKILDKNVNVTVGKYYLAPSPNGDMFSRALVLQIENSKALCFYVDYGDETVVDVSSLKYLPSKFITKLPYQAIQCRLYGIYPAFDEWDDEGTDILYKYMLEPDSDIFRSLFVQVNDKESSESLRSDVKYSVLLKDGFGDNKKLINQLMVDCGFAMYTGNTLEDFELPYPDTVDSDVDNLANEHEFRESDFDMELIDVDAEELLTLMLGYTVKPYQERQLTDEKTENSDVGGNVTTEKLGDHSPSTSLTPEVYWSQAEKVVKLKIKLIGVKEYKASVFQKRIFIFWTNLEGKIYELKFTLFKTVEIGKHRALGQEVQVILHKVEAVEWLQLTGTKKRMRNIHYEVPDYEEKKPSRKFLQLDITDDESDEDDRIMYHEVSDLDSEFDEEAPSSSD